MKERTSLGKLITLSNTQVAGKPKGGFKSERRLESTTQEVAYLQDESGTVDLARQESARQIDASKITCEHDRAASLSDVHQTRLQENDISIEQSRRLLHV